MEPVIPALLADSPGTRIRDYMNIQIGRIGNQAFRQRRLAEYAFSRGRTPPITILETPESLANSAI